MVTFKERSFVIEIETPGNPMEGWLNLHEELLEIQQCVDTNLTTGRRFDCILDLLNEMMPDWKTALKMIN